MKVPIFEAAPNFTTVKQSERVNGQGNGLFGEILNLKLQNHQAEPEMDGDETAEGNKDLMHLLSSVLDVLQDLQEKEGNELDEVQQELLQKSIDLLESIDDAEFLKTEAVLKPVLEKFVLSFGQLDSGAEKIDTEKLSAFLKDLTESIRFTSQKREGFHFEETNQTPLKHNLYVCSDMLRNNGDHHAAKAIKGQFISDPENTEAENAKPLSTRLETANTTKEDSARMTTLTKVTENRGTITENIPSKADTTSGQASNVNRNDTEEVIVRLTETSSNERKGRELIRQFTNILQKSHFSQGVQMKSMTLRLYPEHLGSLRIELTQQNGTMIARILASSNMAKDILDSQIHQLRHAFIQQNIQVDKVDISYQEGLDKYSSQGQRNEDQEESGADQSSDKEAFNGDKDEEEFSKFLQKVLFEMEV
ncbi:MAG TPA: flagellar hook-length control protein FliK [Bacillus bacterium]|uniref:Flagellar hook-length control protein-like C-terminal domain-containing protein n=1 Tax=Siminovitchia fordii TaxID=254759 RepID=A0ABQ4JZG1_9BACI|nr:flagellar hook-length control protein FliK [Siminovitchia fordii]GIN18940.1 hypothetical protein J1TS3_00740 [Siminovitchia fordii]HBZ10445.1 flagellar hook-length control protein FliK [Bacillus sp. (in: firmicutes)]